MKRFLSIFLALVMLLSMVTVSYADEPITVEYWNANTSTIVLELSHNVTAAALEAAITLADEDGTPVAIDGVYAHGASPVNSEYTSQKFVERTNGQYMSVRPLTPNNYVYTIVPEDGFEFGTEYRLTIADTLTNGTATVSGTNILDFTVTKLFVEGFDTVSWHSNGTVSNGVITMSDGVRIDNSATVNFADTGKSATSYRTAKESLRTKINLEVDAKVADTTVGHKVGLGLVSAINTRSIEYADSVIFKLGADDEGTRLVGAGLSAYKNDPTYTLEEGKTQYKSFVSALNPVLDANYFEHTSAQVAQEGKATPFVSGEYVKLAMFYDDDADKLVFGGANDYYSYGFDMGTALSENTTAWMPYLIAQDVKDVTMDNLIMSYATGTLSVVAFSNTVVEAPVSWNAASDTITLDFNTDVTASALEDAITLVDPDGEEIAVTVTKLADVTKSGYGTGRHAYKISLPAGTRFADEEAYKLTISSAVSLVDDGDEYTFHKLAQDYVLNFKVDLFVVEEFNYEEGAQAISLDTNTRENDGTIVAENELPWSLSMSSKKGTMTIAKDGDNKYAKVNVTGKAFFSPYADNDVNFANTNMDGRAFADSTLKDVSEFTTEMDLKVVSTSNANGAYDVRLYETKLAYSTGWASNYNNQLISMVVWSSASSPYNKLMRPAAHSLANGGSYYSSNTQQTSVSKSKAEAANWPAVGGDYVRVSVSEKDGNHKFLIGNAVTSMDQDASLSAVNNAIPALGFNENNTSVTSEYHIDNIILSKATEIEIASSTEFGDLAVTVGGEAIDTLAGQTAVDVSVPVTRVGAALPVKAVVAVYNTATNEMTNVVMSTITSIADSTTFSFENVALNGGNVLSVYFWENFETLLPYVVPFDFPAVQ